MELRPFQRTFLKNALSAKYDTAILSIPRGNGKSTLAGHILERGDDSGRCVVVWPVARSSCWRHRWNKRGLSFEWSGLRLNRWVAIVGWIQPNESAVPTWRPTPA